MWCAHQNYICCPYNTGPPTPLNKSGSNILHALIAPFAVCSLFLFIGCGNSAEDESQLAYLGGEIVNPTSNHIILKHKGVILDTIPLNEENRFNYKLEDVKTGVYIIEHRPETQNIFISPGDSLLFRANTLAFDESLHFSGKGEAQNNFMSEMFLEDEKTARLLLTFFEYNPTRFAQIADSIYRERETSLDRVHKKHNFSEEFLDLSRNIISYENRDLKERYTFLVQKYYKEYAKQFSPDFHNYRNDVDFNSQQLQCSPGYRRFLENYLINYSLTWCANSGLDNEDCYNLSNEENVKARLRKAGDLIELPSLRKYLLKKIAVRGIVMAKSRESIISILQTLQEQNISEEDLDEMRQLGTIQLAFLPGIALSQVPLVNMKGELENFESVVNKPTIVFLWSINREGHIEQHRKVNQLRKKYPEIDFIGVNLDVGEEPSWRVAVRQHNYPLENEYQLGPTRIQNEFFGYYIEKILFLNPSAEVVKGDIFLSSPEFESHLVEFLNQ